MPEYDELIKYSDTLWNERSYVKFVINYLLIYYQVRNLDLCFEIVTTKKATKEDETKNYLWVDKNHRRIVYIRNNYKTFKNYGQKVMKIDDKRFYLATRRININPNLKKDVEMFLCENSSRHYHIQSKTYKNLGEGAIFKIIVNHFSHDLQKLREISYNRGTNIHTIATHYDIQNLPEE